MEGLGQRLRLHYCVLPWLCKRIYCYNNKRCVYPFALRIALKRMHCLEKKKVEIGSAVVTINFSITQQILS